MSMPLKKILTWASILIYFGVFFLVYSREPLPKLEKGIVFLLPVIFLAGASVYFYVKSRVGVFAKTSLYFLLGSFSLLVAEFLWIGFDIFLSEPPYPSLADIFYLISYPLLFAGVLTQVRVEKLNLQSSFFGFSSIILFLLMGVTFYFGILQAYDIEASIWLNVVFLAYGIADVFVLVMALLVLNTAFLEKINSRAWILFALGMASTWIGDLLYALYYEPFNEGVYPYILIDITWVLWYFLMGFSFLYFVSDSLKKPPLPTGAT